MKKILFGMLALSTLVLGAQDEQQKEVTVTARVVTPLKMEVISNVDYGLLYPGQTKEAEDKKGHVQIKGTPGENIGIYVKTNQDSDFKKLGDAGVHTGSNAVKNNIVTLKHTKEEDKKFQVALSIYAIDNAVPDQAEATVLNNEGEMNLMIGGSITVPQGQKDGLYMGSLTLKALYE